MTLVRIAANWTEPNILRQTPGGLGVWDGVRFTREAVENPDYMVVLNCAPKGEMVTCDPERLWVVMMEPPEGEWPEFHKGNPEIRRIYTSDESLRGPKYCIGNPALPWQVGRSYDQLIREDVPTKTHGISCVTSSKARYEGHRRRLRFIEQAKGSLEFDLFGKGFAPIEDKWDALAPYKYSIAIENHRNAWYWTEKIADCFLAWTMPVYYGCSGISRFFPREAFIEIDIDDPVACEKINEAVRGDLWERNFDAIAYARELVLERYQFFPMMRNEIASYEAARGVVPMAAERLDLYNLTRPKMTIASRVKAKLSAMNGG